MIHSINWVKISSKVGFQLLHLLSRPNSLLFKAHAEFRLYSFFPPNTSFGGSRQVLLTLNDWSVHFVVLSEDNIPLQAFVLHLSPGNTCLGSSPSPMWNRRLWERNSNKTKQRKKLLKSHGAALLPLNCDLAGYWFPSSFLSQKLSLEVLTLWIGNPRS